MANERDVYEIDTSGGQASLKRLADGMDQLAKTAEQSSVQQTKAFFTAAAAYDLAKQALGGVIDFMKESVAAAAEAERAEKMLASVAGINTAAFKAQAQAMQQTLGVSDDMVMSLQTMALRFGAAPQDVKKTTLAVLDYAKATGKDATEAMRSVLTGVQRGKDGMAALGIQYKSTENFTKDLALATDALGKKYGGSAAADADTFAGRMRAVDTQLGEVKEGFGKFIGEVVDRTGVLWTLAEALKGVNTALFGDEALDGQVARAEKQAALTERRTQLREALKLAEEQQKAEMSGGWKVLSPEESQESIRAIVARADAIDGFKASIAALTKELDTLAGQQKKAGNQNAGIVTPGPGGADAEAAKAAAAAHKEWVRQVVIDSANKADAYGKELEGLGEIYDQTKELERLEAQNAVAAEERLRKFREGMEWKSDAYEKDIEFLLEYGDAAEGIRRLEQEQNEQRRDSAKAIQEKMLADLKDFRNQSLQFVLAGFKEELLRNHAYTEQYRAASVKRRADDEAEQQLRRDLTEERWDDLALTEQITLRNARADDLLAGMQQQLASEEKAANDKRLASFLAAIGEQAALQALFQAAEGAAALAGVVTAGKAGPHFAAAAAYGAVAAAAGVAASSLAQSRGLTSDEQASLESLKEDRLASRRERESKQAKEKDFDAAPAVTVNYYGISGFTQSQQARELERVMREAARLKTGSA